MRKAVESNNSHIVGFHETIVKCNQLLLKINQSLYAGAPLAIVQKYLQLFWACLHNMRLQQTDQENFFIDPLNLAAYQATKMRDAIINDNTIQRDDIKKAYQLLKSYTRNFEKALVKEWYYIETLRQTKAVGPISWAAKISNKSQITVRRYIADDRILGYQIYKRCWIPIDEVEILRDWNK